MDVLARLREHLGWIELQEGETFVYQRTGKYELFQLLAPSGHVHFEYRGVEHPNVVCEGNPCRWCGYTQIE